MTVLREIIAHFAVTTDRAQLDKLNEQLDNAKQKLTSFGDALARIGLARQGIAALADIFRATGIAQAVEAASDTNEELNVLNETFKESSGSVLAWADSVNESLGRSEYSLRKAAGAFGAFLSPLIGNKNTIADMSEQLAALAVDLGSFYNIKDEEATTRLFSGLAGETEAVRRLGIDLTEAGLGAFAASQGITKSTQEMTQSEKTVLRFNKILVDTREKQGDAARTADEFANSTKRLQERVYTLAVSIGERLLYIVTPLVHALDRGASALTWVAEKTRLFEASVTAASITVGVFAARWVQANATMLLSAVRTWAPIIGRMALAGAAVLAVIAVVEDLIVLFDGGQSVVGDFVDSIFGIGTAEEVVVSIKQAFDELFYAAQRALAVIGLADEPTMTPEQMRQRRRTSAVQSGDLNAYLAEKTAGRTREQAREDFLSQRQRFLTDRPAAATAQDVGAGLVGRVAEVSAPRAAAAAKIEAPKVDIHLPPGTPAEQAKELEKVVEGVMDKHHRRTLAAFGGLAP